MTLQRRKFLKTLGASASGAALAGCTTSAGGGGEDGVATGPAVNWRLASSFPRSLDIIFGSAERLAARIAQLTGGRFNIRVHPAGELVPGLQVMDAVQQGTVQVGQTTSYYYLGKNPALAFDSAVPFGLTARQQYAWLWHGGGLQALREVFAQFGIIQFPVGNTGTQFGGWFRRDINSVADLRGLRMRIPGIGGEVMSRLGVSVQVLAGGEIYPALERGAIDATEWVGPHDDERLGFNRIAHNYYYPGWHEPGVNVALMVSLNAWNSLPETYQFAIECAAAEQNAQMLAQYDHANPLALAKLLEAGVQARAYPADVLEAAWRETNVVLDEYAARDATFRSIYESWKAYRVQSWRYFAGNEQAYATCAFPQLVGSV
jgi:TRAP-type mannitol/chloroaromatic compound transport system substrate-binding protein